jgi:hypothetical protein
VAGTGLQARDWQVSSWFADHGGPIDTKKGPRTQRPEGRSLPLVRMDRGRVEHALEGGSFNISVGAADGLQH